MGIIIFRGGGKMKNCLRSYKKVLSTLLAVMLIVTMSPTGVFARPVESENLVENTKAEKYTQIEIGKGTSFKGKDNSALGKNNLPKKVKSKLDTNLLKLTNKQSMGVGESKESLKASMKLSDQLVSKGAAIKNDKSAAPNDMVFVYIKTKTSEGLKEVEPYIFKLVNKDEKEGLMAAWVEVSKLQQFELFNEVVNVTTVTKPMVNATGEGDVFHRADMIRKLSSGTIGSGVKVGVISNGVNSLTKSVNLGELPPQVKILSDEGYGDEGTAMLEIIHDLAPGAELYFHDCGNNLIAFNSAVDDLVAAGCQIVVDDIGWFNEPFFEDGVIGSHIREVVNTTGINYISSAGNSGASHYQGMYCNDGSNWHDFSAGQNAYKNIYARVNPGEIIRGFLQWDDPFEDSTNDYDLYIYSAHNGEQLGYSNRVQAGGTYPFEDVGYINWTSAPMDVVIKVANRNGSAQPKNLELYVWGHCYSQNTISSDSIFGQPAIPEVIAAGAIDVPNPNAIASYSSQGPVTTRSGEVRRKPDICGAAGVSVSGVGGFPSTFYGTSAAAPHIAAIAALMRSKYPTKTGKEIRDLIQNNAVDYGKSGFDNIFGYGKADAYKAFMAAGPGEGILAAGITLDKTNLAIGLGKYGNILATVNPAEASNKSITWSSSNNLVATVDDDGRVTGVSKGSATITATTVFGGYTESCEVTVGNAVSTVEIISELTLKKWEQWQLSLRVLPEDAVNKGVRWISINPKVATVDSNGVVNAVGDGYTIIHAVSDDGPCASCFLTVTGGLQIKPVRYAGTNRFETAVQVSKAGWQASETVVLSNAYGFADALAGVPFAFIKDAPILLTETNSIPAATSDEMERLGAKNVYILGGAGVVSQKVEDDLKEKGLKVFRFAGSDRFETAIKVGSEVMKKNLSRTAILTTAYNYPDALAISPAAAVNQLPILYTSTESLNVKTKEFIRQNGIRTIIIPGGVGAVSQGVADELESMGIYAIRMSGPDRYYTALNIVKQFSNTLKGDIMIATGNDFPDALAGGVLAAKKQIPILLVDTNSVSDPVRNFIRLYDNINMYILGGTGAVSDNVVNKIVSN